MQVWSIFFFFGRGDKLCRAVDGASNYAALFDAGATNYAENAALFDAGATNNAGRQIMAQQMG